MRIRLWIASVFLVVMLGCGSSDTLVPVSGKVTFDGHPLSGADVSFKPTAPPKGIVGQTTSHAKTDEQGNFTLKTLDGEPGAVVGKHKVSISQLTGDPGSDERPTRAGSTKDKIPAKYNKDTKLEFEVPADGTTSANFELKSEPAGKPKGKAK